MRNSMNIEELKRMYDVENHIEKGVIIPSKPPHGLVLLVGKSGSGKSTILKNWFDTTHASFDVNVSVIENFSSLDKGKELLTSFGLRSIPTWFRPFNTLSNGEAHRAHCALCIDNGVNYIDEFTSVVDRDTAKSLSASVKKYHTRTGGLLVIATCHRDVEEWLCPDLVYDTDSCVFVNGRYRTRPSITLEITTSTVENWVCFKKHHYLSDELPSSCHCYVARFDGKDVAFLAVIHRCGRYIKSYRGECRLVVLPEFQGLGVGKALSEAIAQE